MSTNTGIEWTDATWNPVRGCSRVSQGCKNCYAEKVASRFSGPGQPYEGLVRIGADGQRRPEWNGNIRFVEERLRDPLKWNKARRIFVNSMSDLFHEGVMTEWIDEIFAVMAHCPQYTFQILTKRPERMREYIAGRAPELRPPGFGKLGPLPNVHLGVSVEDQETANQRIPLLLEAPAAVRFISYEPALGPVDLQPFLSQAGPFEHAEFPPLNWVIVGGESGPGARPSPWSSVFQRWSRLRLRTRRAIRLLPASPGGRLAQLGSVCWTKGRTRVACV